MNSKDKKSKNIMKVVLGTCLTLYAISLFIPFIWTLITSFRSQMDVALNGYFNIPREVTFSHYESAWLEFEVQVATRVGSRKVFIEEMFLNTIIYSISTAFFGTLMPCITGYLCAKYPYRFGRFIYALVVVLMLIPVVGTMPAMLVLLKNLGIYDTLLAQIIMNAGFANTYFLIFYSTFKGLSDGYSEAARIDGASDTCVMFQIMFPLVKTSILIVFLLLFIARWNNYMDPMMYYPSHPTIGLGLNLYTQQGNTLPQMLAASMIVITPILVLFLIFKKYLMGNLTMGGLKG